MQLLPNDVHIWTIALTLTDNETQDWLLLDHEEQARAARFHFPIHRERFIRAHSGLRQILAAYLQTKPQDIAFSYTKYKKPQLAYAGCPLKFNLSHSDAIAICAITLQHAIGVDIEKEQADLKTDIAKRYFSPKESDALFQLPPHQQVSAFYRLWSRKEAIIKAIGRGLYIPLSSFSVSVEDKQEEILIEDNYWSLVPLSISLGYQAALATNQRVKSLHYWTFFNQHSKLDKVVQL